MISSGTRKTDLLLTHSIESYCTMRSSYLLQLFAFILLAMSVSALSNGHVETPLMGQVWEDCTPSSLQDHVQELRSKLPAYDVVQVGRNCTPAKKSARPFQASGISLALNLGDDCTALASLDPHQLRSWNVSLVSLHKTCLQPTKYRFTWSKKQLAKLHGVAVGVCSTDETDSPWLWAPSVANQWCIPSLTDSSMSDWDRMLTKLDNTVAMAQFAGPGAWNDLGPLQVGAWADKASDALKAAMDRSHFALWAVLKSPLMVSAPPQTLSESSLAVLNNQGLININQDPLGVPGALIWKQGSLELYAAPISDPQNTKLMGQRAVVCFNRGDKPSSDKGCVINWAQLGYPAGLKVVVQNLFHSNETTEQIYQYTTGTVGPRDVVVLRLSPFWSPETSKMKWDMWRPWQQNKELFLNRCDPPGAVMGGVALMTIAVIGIIFAGLTVYWVRASPSKKGFQPLNSNTKEEEEA